MAEALKTSGLITKRETVEEGLKMLIRLKKQEKMKECYGKFKWEGDLDAMRIDK